MPDEITPPSDRELHARWNEGDEDACEELWRRHFRKLMAHSRKLRVTGKDFEDLAQEAFWAMEQQNAGKVASFLGYACAVATNLAWKSWRRHLEGLPAGHDPPVLPADLALQFSLNRCAERLSEKQLEALELFRLGHTYAEIGKKLGISEEAARQSLRAAEDNLRKCLQGNDPAIRR